MTVYTVSVLWSVCERTSAYTHMLMLRMSPVLKVPSHFLGPVEEGLLVSLPCLKPHINHIIVRIQKRMRQAGDKAGARRPHSLTSTALDFFCVGRDADLKNGLGHFLVLP